MYRLELLDTVEMMCSTDYKDRFRAEYMQLKIRHDKLRAITNKWDHGGIEELGFTPTCPREIYEYQLKHMRDYMDVLEYRAKLEGVDLRC